jgi:hypothetical protein
VGCSERQKELKRRRHRREKLSQLELKAKSANPSEKLVIAEKIRQLTPGGEEIIARLGLDER